jgi:predicted branched-subunit amino acid permease
MKDKDTFRLIAQGIGALILVWILYQVWPLIVGVLAICGGHYLLQQWRDRKKR